MMDGYQPGDPMVAVFAYQADPAGRPEEQIAAEAMPSTTTPGTPTARTWPAAITSAGCGLCRSPETHRVAADRVAFAERARGDGKPGCGDR
jgi:hypothetical protein